jgi:hypothetical protein
MHVGLEVMAQEEAKMAEEEKTLDAVNTKIRSEKVKTLFGEQ